MPELPEVETVVRHLDAALLGRRIRVVRTSGLRLRQPVSRIALRRTVGRVFARVRRRGKYILCGLDDGAQLVFHLGMSGHLVLEPETQPLPSHTHVVFALDRGRLRFSDPRRFGLVKLCAGNVPELARLGLDPLDPALTPEQLWTRLCGTRRAIKDALLDQERVAGLGNIYTCEALHRARIDPRRRVPTLASEEVARLLASIRAVLKEAIARRGTTLPDGRYVGGDGRPGENFDALLVFGRAGAPCHACGRPITRIRQGSRSTFLCASCQG